MIFLTQRQIDLISREAENAYPRECCGMLVGKDNPNGGIVVSRIVVSPNVFDETAKDRFQVDPQIQIDLFRELRETEERIIGHYHSHPDHPAETSATDLEKAWEPELVWLIVAVANGKAEMVKAHRIDPATGRFEELSLQIGGSTS